MTTISPTATTLPSPTTIEFEGAHLIADIGTTPAETFVAMKPIVEAMGVSWQGQHDKLTRHPVLSKVSAQNGNVTFSRNVKMSPFLR